MSLTTTTTQPLTVSSTATTTTTTAVPMACKDKLPGFTKIPNSNKRIQKWDSFIIDSIAGSFAFCTAKGLSLQSAAGSVEYDNNGNEIKQWTITCYIRCDEPTLAST